MSTPIALWLADGPPRNTGPDYGKASPVGLLIVVLLLICTGFLVWSMNRHLKKLPKNFDRDNPGPDQAADDGTVGVHDTNSGDTGNDNRSAGHEPGG